MKTLETTKAEIAARLAPLTPFELADLTAMSAAELTDIAEELGWEPCARCEGSGEMVTSEWGPSWDQPEGCDVDTCDHCDGLGYAACAGPSWDDLRTAEQDHMDDLAEATWRENRLTA